MIAWRARSDAVPRSAVADPGARRRFGFVKAQHQSPIRQEIETAKAVKIAHRLDPQAPGLALVSKARIEEAVAQHPLTAVDRRADRLVDMVGARRGEQQGFGPRAPARLIALKQKRANGFGIRTSAGFSRNNDRQPAPL